MYYTLENRQSFPETTGVYSISFQNSEIKKVYIGSATKRGHRCPSENGFRVRWNRHIRLLRRNKHHSSKLQNAYNKYGEENTIFQIIEESEPQDCLDREDYYLELFDSYKNGYNMKPKASSCLGYKVPTEVKNENERQRRLLRASLEGDAIKIYQETKNIAETARKLGVPHSTIKLILRDYKIKHFKSGEFRERPIYCYNLQGEFIGEWESAKKCAKELGLSSDANIGRVAAEKSKYIQYKGYVFRYSPKSEKEILSFIDEKRKKKAEIMSEKIRLARDKEGVTIKNIKQFDLEGNFIREWKDINEIKNFFKIKTNNICAAIKGKIKTSLGFKWSL